MVQLYRDASYFLQGIDTVGTLKDDPSSIENLVTSEYKKIKSRLMLTFQQFPKSDIVDFKLSSDCNFDNDPFVCLNTKTGDVINYFMKIKLNEKYCRNNVRHKTNANHGKNV